jgi:hypothetical protein
MISGQHFSLPVQSGYQSLAEIVCLYGLRNWVEESYRRMKDELGWADFMVRSDRAIRRHWTLVCCAFAFCWWYEAYRARMIDEATQMACEPSTEPNPPQRKKPARRNSRTVRSWLTPAHWLTRC